MSVHSHIKGISLGYLSTEERVARGTEGGDAKEFGQDSYPVVTHSLSAKRARIFGKGRKKLTSFTLPLMHCARHSKGNRSDWVRV